VFLLAIPALAAAAYYLLALIAGIALRPRPARPPASYPQISILKPLHGSEPSLWRNLVEHAEQDYPAELEILCGVTDPRDAAIEHVERAKTECPNVPIELHVVETTAPNVKAGVLAELAKRARYPILLVNDADISVPNNYLREVAATLDRPDTGLVTCLYSAEGRSLPSSMEAAGVATEFVPSVLVARLLGVAEFALGSTMAFRKSTLGEIGGFETIAPYLADDYQLGAHVSRLGYRIRFAGVTVSTDLGEQTWAEVWRHQVRWSRTIRVSRPSGYYGYAVTHATVWALVAALAGYAWVAMAAVLLRLAAGYWIAARVLKTKATIWMLVRDLFGFAVWISGLFGSTVVWRGKLLRLRRDGRLVS
jgi:ceramide glucosyltransferase